eukprot:4813331-Pleurochrysis_carterae.AAC.1
MIDVLLPEIETLLSTKECISFERVAVVSAPLRKARTSRRRRGKRSVEEQEDEQEQGLVGRRPC